MRSVDSTCGAGLNGGAGPGSSGSGRANEAETKFQTPNPKAQTNSKSQIPGCNEHFSGGLIELIALIQLVKLVLSDGLDYESFMLL